MQRHVTRHDSPPPAGATVGHRTSTVFLALAFGIVLGAGDLQSQAFGNAVTVAGGRIFASEPFHEREPGTVRVYEMANGWSELTSIRAPEPELRDRFGSSLAQAGDHLIVGAATGDGQGSVYVYDIDDLEGDPLQILSSPETWGFGRAIAAHGARLVASGDDQDGNPVLATFERGADGSWAEAGMLRLAPGSAGRSTHQIGLGEGVLAVGSQATGGVAIYELGGRGWMADGTVVPGNESGRESSNILVTGVAVAGGEVLIGWAPEARQPSVVSRYSKGPQGWAVMGELTLPSDVSLVAPVLMASDGTSLAVGSGAVALAYSRNGAGWDFQGTGDISRLAITSPGAATSLGVSGTVTVLGMPTADFGLGAVAAWTSDEPGQTGLGLITVEQTPLPVVSGGEVLCDDGTAAGYDCDHVDLLSFLPRESLGASRGARLNDVWGWTDPETGREYAILGRMDGTSFVDVTDAYNPRYLGNLPRTMGSPASTWRDAKVFRDHAFIVADGAGEHGMQVFDLRQLRAVTEPREFEPTVLYRGVASTHNIAINENTGFAYLVGSSGGGMTCGSGSHIVDINEPLNPVFAGCFAHPNTGRRGTGNTHDAQCVTYHGPDEEYTGREICVSSNETALSVADVTDKDNPVAIAAADYPNVAYAHQGWFTEDHRHFYSNDELDEVGGLVEATRTLIWDLADLDDPVLVREYDNPTRATDHNLYVRGDRLYMSNNRAGLRVMDISDPENPVEVAYFDTTPWSADEAGFDGTWSVYPYFESGSVLLSSRREGLFIVRPRARSLIP